MVYVNQFGPRAARRDGSDPRPRLPAATRPENIFSTLWLRVLITWYNLYKKNTFTAVSDNNVPQATEH
jgi:hypothetical protein